MLHGNPDDLFIQKVPASTIGDLAEAVQKLAEESYISDNTERLDVERTISKIMTVEYIQKALENREDEVAQ